MRRASAQPLIIREEELSTIIRPLTKDDLPAARRIFCTAFGTFLGAPDPENFWADLDYVYGRFAAEHVLYGSYARPSHLVSDDDFNKEIERIDRLWGTGEYNVA